MIAQYHKIALTVAFGFALALTFSCSGNDDSGGSEPKEPSSGFVTYACLREGIMCSEANVPNTHLQELKKSCEEENEGMYATDKCPRENVKVECLCEEDGLEGKLFFYAENSYNTCQTSGCVDINASSSSSVVSSSSRASSSSVASSSSKASSSSVAVGKEIININFTEVNTFSPFTTNGSVKLDPDKYGVMFEPTGNGNNWDTQLLLRNLNIKKNFSYKIDLGGGIYNTGESAEVEFVFMNCTGTNYENCSTPYETYPRTFSFNYGDTSDKDGKIAPIIWKNCQIDNPNATFAINGGKPGNKNFKITWISIREDPVTCP